MEQPAILFGGRALKVVQWPVLFIPLFLIFLLTSFSTATCQQVPRAIGRQSPEVGAVTPPDQKRVALVIGNAQYEGHQKLNCPSHDAQDISTVLRQLGFSVMTKVDANHREMDEAIDKFVE